MNFSKNLRQLFAERNVVRADLSGKTGLSESTLTNYLNGKIPQSLASLVALSRYLEVSLDELVFGDRIGNVTNQVRHVQDVLHQHTIQMEQRVERQSDLLIRVMSAVRKDLDRYVALAVKENESFSTSLISERDIQTIEMNSDSVISITPLMRDEILNEGGQIKRGPFYKYVVDNFRDNPDVQYMFYTGAVLPEDVEKQFKKLLTEDGVSTEKATTLSIKRTSFPIALPVILYQIRPRDVQESDTLLFERLREFISEKNEIGVVLSPAERTQVNMLMDEEHIVFTRSYIEAL